MPARSSRPYKEREEVLNVRLAELLTKRGLLSIPETIIKGIAGAQITRYHARLWGVRIVIEGRTLTTSTAKNSLFVDAKNRVEQGISPIGLAVLYLKNLGEVDAEMDIGSEIERSALTVRVISEGGEGEWTESTLMVWSKY